MRYSVFVVVVVVMRFLIYVSRVTGENYKHSFTIYKYQY